jgi:hypothetical protein
MSWICIVLAHCNNSLQVVPLGHIILILIQPVFALSPYCCVCIGDAPNTNFIVIGLTRLGLEPTIYRKLTITPPMRLVDDIYIYIVYITTTRIYIYNIDVLTVNIKFMWLGLEMGKRLVLMSLSISFVPSHVNSIFTINKPILYLFCNKIYKKKCDLI